MSEDLLTNNGSVCHHCLFIGIAAIVKVNINRQARHVKHSEIDRRASLKDHFPFQIII